MNRRMLLLSTALTLLPLGALAQGRLPVAASFSILGDMVAEVGGDRVEVTTIVPAGADAHVFQPAPADAKAMTEAAVIVVNGLGFEGWLDRLVEASGATAPIVVVSDGITPLEVEDEDHHEEQAEDEDHDHEVVAAGGDRDHDHEEVAAGEAHDHEAQAEAEAHGDGHDHDHGGLDPHAWQSLANARVYVDAIEAGLSAADPEGADVYAANAAAYRDEIDTLEADVEAAIAALPADRRVVVTSHDAFGYFAAAYGLTFAAPQGLSTESEASAADVAALIRQIRAQEIPAVFVETVTDPRLLEQITRETGAVIGGTLYSDALSGSDGPAATYLEMMRHNLVTLTAALGV